MIATSLGFFAFGIGLLVHWGMWSVCVPKRQTSTIAKIFLVAAVLSAIGFAAIVGLSIWDVAYAIMLWGGLSASYILTYTGVEYDSPTLSLIYQLATKGERGMSEEELEAFIAARPFVATRLHQLYRDGFVINHGDRLELAVRSSLTLRLCESYRGLMGRTTSGG